MASVLKKLLALVSNSLKPHTRLPSAITRVENAPGFIDDRERTEDGIVSNAPRKIIPDLEGNGVEVSEDYPVSKAYEQDSTVVEATVPRQVRGQKDDTLTEVHDALTTFDVAIGPFVTGSNPTVTQPVNPFDAEYPYNHARITESGHLVELDDTPGAERIKTSHRIGTFTEVRADGTTVTKIVRDNFRVVVNDDTVNIQGNAIVTVDGNCNMYVKGNFIHEVDGDYDLLVKGNHTTQVLGDKKQYITKQYISRSSKDTEITGGPNVELNPNGPIDG